MSTRPSMSPWGTQSGWEPIPAEHEDLAKLVRREIKRNIDQRPFVGPARTGAPQPDAHRRFTVHSGLP